jgi:hypothetical protein
MTVLLSVANVESCESGEMYSSETDEAAAALL